MNTVYTFIKRLYKSLYLFTENVEYWRWFMVLTHIAVQHYHGQGG